MSTTPTAAQLQAAHEALRRRLSTWPEHLEDAQADSVRARLLRFEALRPHRTARPAPVSTSSLRPRHAPQSGLAHPPTFDRKRAAAGERDDD
ncbi:hypothetical protein P3G55_17415 [Leptospira sp. 96542]|nr:hypothetical protein [Leptospira sp. 96542]